MSIQIKHFQSILNIILNFHILRGHNTTPIWERLENPRNYFKRLIHRPVWKQTVHHVLSFQDENVGTYYRFRMLLPTIVHCSKRKKFLQKKKNQYPYAVPTNLHHTQQWKRQQEEKTEGQTDNTFLLVDQPAHFHGISICSTCRHRINVCNIALQTILFEKNVKLEFIQA